MDVRLKHLPKLSSRETKVFAHIVQDLRDKFRYCTEGKVLECLDKYPSLKRKYTTYAEKVDIPKQERWYIFSGNVIGTCKNSECSNVTSFRPTWNRYLDFCCKYCANQHVKEARKETWLKKYGTDNPARNPQIRQKISRSVSRHAKTLGHVTPKRDFSYQPVLPNPVYSDTSNQFYVYALLDPRKPGRFKYGRWTFDYEPFYIGKGKGSRAYSHLRRENKKGYDSNNLKKNKIRKILRETGEYPIVCIKRKNLPEIDAHQLEIKLIQAIGRQDCNLGPLTNHTDGGEGVVGGKWTSRQRKDQAARLSRYMASLTKEQRSEIYGRKSCVLA